METIQPAVPGVVGNVTASDARKLQLPDALAAGPLEVRTYRRTVAVWVHPDEWRELMAEREELRRKVAEMEAR